MPVILNQSVLVPERHSKWGRETEGSLPIRGSSVGELNIGLINNMPDGALEATERQFFSLLEAASGHVSIGLHLYSLNGVPRGESVMPRITHCYTSTDGLTNARLDGLIVTGREPLSADLANEPYWESFARVLEWACKNTHSTIWSCLAAHAAVQYMDGIVRVRNARKYCGVLDCRHISDHFLTAGVKPHFHLPHSRWNGLPQEALVQRGYSVLTQTRDAGVDSFCKQGQSLFVFFQGHPEYEANTLLLEYRRDVQRYFRGDTPDYPSIPQGYFDAPTEAELVAIEQMALHDKSGPVLDLVLMVLQKAAVTASWRPAATLIYRNWLQYLLERREFIAANEGSFKTPRNGRSNGETGPALPVPVSKAAGSKALSTM